MADLIHKLFGPKHGGHGKHADGSGQKTEVDGHVKHQTFCKYISLTILSTDFIKIVEGYASDEEYKNTLTLYENNSRQKSFPIHVSNIRGCGPVVN